jgi:hypothetical protein
MSILLLFRLDDRLKIVPMEDRRSEQPYYKCHRYGFQRVLLSYQNNAHCRDQKACPRTKFARESTSMCASLELDGTLLGWSPYTLL